MWDLVPAGSWGLGTTSDPANMADALALDRSWPWDARRLLVHRPQWPELGGPPAPQPPTITGALSPNNGPGDGGTTSMLPGTGFVGATRVTYTIGTWTADAVAFEVVSDLQLWAESPRYEGGQAPPVAATVTVHHPLGNATRANAFIYMSAPT